MSTDDVLIECDERVAILTLNRPRYRNAQSWALLDALDARLDEAMGNPEATSTTRSSGETYRSLRLRWCRVIAFSVAG